MWTSSCEHCTAGVSKRGENLSTPHQASEPSPCSADEPEPSAGSAHRGARVFHTTRGKRWEFAVDKYRRTSHRKRFAAWCFCPSRTRTPRTGRGVRGRSDAAGSDVEAEVQDVAFLHAVLLPSRRRRPASLAPASPLYLMKSSYAMVSARMKPFSKSVWMTAAACGAWRLLRTVHARTSFTPAVK